MAPRLFACFGRGRGRAATSSESPEANATVDQIVEEQRRMGPVLVELFSSQGCGTSPEAEAVATQLGRGELVGDLPPVAVLGFHVEYWDYRGWKDPFGSSNWTVRQKAYVDALHVDTLYTPQVVVNGRAQCVGTDLDAISAALRSVPRFPSPTMQATFQKPAPDTLQVSFTGALRSKVVGRADVMVALYESGLVTDCDKGENKGRVLTNNYVVRRLEKLVSVKGISPKKNLSASLQFTLWDGFNAATCGLLLFVQNASLHTFGVQQFQIPEDTL
ncbi:Secreted protein [Musa troglodytarum]|uniref:Secreted protein n=1 Tax=Musa troglodytarum TaxID=320322 RepID=A0A9E7HV72_9LILI|nr:Secreted protein [Musa troglodytarum]